ncbi:hypothetical protein FRC07_007868 [Ceratobasidium sp. 392]|nr:hypothetical protein FRC07_007868 [Ceratobasidium sp. 392]
MISVDSIQESNTAQFASHERERCYRGDSPPSASFRTSPSPDFYLGAADFETQDFFAKVKASSQAPQVPNGGDTPPSASFRTSADPHVCLVQTDTQSTAPNSQTWTSRCGVFKSSGAVETKLESQDCFAIVKASSQASQTQNGGDTPPSASFRTSVDPRVCLYPDTYPEYSNKLPDVDESAWSLQVFQCRGNQT